MSDVKKPIAGEWWGFTDGFRLFVVGKKLNGSLLCQTDCGAIEVYAIGGDEWKHLPDCDSFDWKPEVFPQYWDAEPDGSAAYNRRDSATKTVCVDKDGTEHEWQYRWEERHWDHLQITKEQAEALLLPKESPEDWVVQNIAPARVGIDQYRYPTSGTIRNRDWHDVTYADNFSSTDFHGKVNFGNRLELRCRRKYLPKPAEPSKITITITRWLCWNDTGKHRLIHASEKPNGFKHCMNVGEEKFEVKS